MGELESSSFSPQGTTFKDTGASFVCWDIQEKPRCHEAKTRSAGRDPPHRWRLTPAAGGR